MDPRHIEQKQHAWPRRAVDGYVGDKAARSAHPAAKSPRRRIDRELVAPSVRHCMDVRDLVAEDL